MPEVFITRKVHFNAAHKMYRPDWSEEKNDSVFGKCANHNWHGHNYELFVTVAGEVNPETGYVLDLKVLTEVVEKEVVEGIDHRNINLDVPFMQGKLASTENLVLGMWEILEPAVSKLGKCRLHSLRLYETERNFVEYFGN
jgi:6-pyruvoyltetrahydropterin/6-carboxytetrahydropterin synthase